MRDIKRKMSSLKVDENDEMEKDEIEDLDVISQKELDELFPPCELVAEDTANNGKYILHTSGTLDENQRFAVGLSNYSVSVYNFTESGISNLVTLSEHTDSIIDVKFVSHDTLYTGSSDGTIRMWDLRTPKQSVSHFEDDTVTDGPKRQLTCFDLSANERVLAAGTEIFSGDPFILFWDLRKRNLLGGYWESHIDTITQVKFHSTDVNRLVSGSTDGLMNIYDISQTCEDDALMETLNSGSSVDRLAWFEKDGDGISCVTHTADVQLWSPDDAEPYVCFSRKDIAESIKKNTEDCCYVCDMQMTSKGVFLLAGSNANDGGCVRGCFVDNKLLTPGFSLSQNKQIVRSSWCNKNTDILITGGEKGILNVWKIPTNENEGSPAKRKRKS